MQIVPLDLFLQFTTMQRSWDGYFLLDSVKTKHPLHKSNTNFYITLFG
jgi:hypothetical protein